MIIFSITGWDLVAGADGADYFHDWFIISEIYDTVSSRLKRAAFTANRAPETAKPGLNRYSKSVPEQPFNLSKFCQQVDKRDYGFFLLY